VTAGFVSRSIFLAFFRYLIPAGQDIRTDPSESNDVATNSPLERNESAANERINAPTDASEGSFDNPMPVYSAPDFNPLMTSQLPSWIADQQPSFFAMNVSIPGDPIQEMKLPNDQSILSRFFAGLERHHFHIYIPGEDPRALSASWCYTEYTQNPHLLLQADFLPELCYESLCSGKRKRTDGVAELNAARSWLEEQTAELRQPSQNKGKWPTPAVWL
jgi:hypothetical protein